MNLINRSTISKLSQVGCVMLAVSYCINAQSLESRLGQNASFIPHSESGLEQLISVAQFYKIPMGIEWANQSTAAVSANPVRKGITVRGLINNKPDRAVSKGRKPLSANVDLGNVLFNVDVNGVVAPLAVRDVSGDGHLEIIVASGGSPSLGGWLQAFDVRGASFRKVAYINGRYFRVTATTVGRPSVIAARWMEEDQATIHTWNGQEFEATEKH